jgi:hypothetical protein
MKKDYDTGYNNIVKSAPELSSTEERIMTNRENRIAETI